MGCLCGVTSSHHGNCLVTALPSRCFTSSLTVQAQAEEWPSRIWVCQQKLRDYSARLTRWHSIREVVVSTFDRHDFAMKWSFAEKRHSSPALLRWAITTAKCIEELIELSRPDLAAARSTARTESFDDADAQSHYKADRTPSVASPASPPTARAPRRWQRGLRGDGPAVHDSVIRGAVGLLLRVAEAHGRPCVSRCSAASSPTRRPGRANPASSTPRRARALAARDSAAHGGIFAECRRVLSRRHHDADVHPQATGAWDALRRA